MRLRLANARTKTRNAIGQGNRVSVIKKYAVKNANDLSAAISLDALASTIVDKN